MKSKILIVTTKFPFPMTGACEADRASGILQLIRLGFDIKVITKITKYQPINEAQAVSKRLGIEIIPVTYKFDPESSKIQKLKKYILRFLTNPLVLDGSAYEFNDREMKNILDAQIKEWLPSLVWFDYTYTWPLYRIVKKYKLPIVTRSINFEPIHFLEENGYKPLNYLRVVPKFISEAMAIKKSDLIFAITPKESKIYNKLGAGNVETLPLRGLPKCLNKYRNVRDGNQLNVFFMGSSYNVSHMRAALLFLLRDIIPAVNKISGSKFYFHIFGGKFPQEYNKYLASNKVVYRGYVEDLEAALDDMDIALIPSLHGAGMQQKIFEPLARGFPTITSPRGLADYPFMDGEHILLASSSDEFRDQLMKLQDPVLRRNLSTEALITCNKIFSQKVLDSIVLHKINNLIKLVE